MARVGKPLPEITDRDAFYAFAKEKVNMGGRETDRPAHLDKIIAESGPELHPVEVVATALGDSFARVVTRDWKLEQQRGQSPD